MITDVVANELKWHDLVGVYDLVGVWEYHRRRDEDVTVSLRPNHVTTRVASSSRREGWATDSEQLRCHAANSLTLPQLTLLPLA